MNALFNWVRGTRHAITSLACLFLSSSFFTVVRADSLATGVVFNDLNRNGMRENNEPGLPGVRVSNQVDIVETDAEGRWQLAYDDDVTFFLIKPQDWQPPVDHHQLPRFFYTHKPHGSPKQQYPGVDPTGELPESIDFPLHKVHEPRVFEAIFFGDPQPRNLREVEYVGHDVVEELIGTTAKFGVTLGDIVFDDLSIFEPFNATVALIGIPWYNVIGNHDINYDAASDRDSDETFTRIYGPSYYAFDYGAVHFLVLDNVLWGGEAPGGSGSYTGGLDQAQLDFIRNDLSRVPEDKLVVLMMHIPLTSMINREDLYRLIENRPYTFSISGHTHWQSHQLIRKEDGWLGAKPHHHLINVTVSGSWWSGLPDEYGIPHTTMRDGAPNGYTSLRFSENKLPEVYFKASRKPEDFQMSVFVDERIPVQSLQTTAVYVNVFNGWEESVVEVRWKEAGVWHALEKTLENDPGLQAVFDREPEIPKAPFRRISAPVASNHLWKGNLPQGVSAGIHVLEVRATDVNGKWYRLERIIGITENPVVSGLQDAVE
jgi:hypothetical protein